MNSSSKASNNDCIWSPKVLKEVVKTIDIIRRQALANSDLLKLNSATKRGITYGIDLPPMDLNKSINSLIGMPSPVEPAFYVASEMSSARIGLSKKVADITNEMRIHSEKTTLCTSSESRCRTLQNEIRSVLNKHYNDRLRKYTRDG